MRDAPLDGASQIMLRSETRLWVARLALVPTALPGESNGRRALLRRVSHLSLHKTVRQAKPHLGKVM
jgi:hypothetical protein